MSMKVENQLADRSRWLPEFCSIAKTLDLLSTKTTFLMLRDEPSCTMLVSHDAAAEDKSKRVMRLGVMAVAENQVVIDRTMPKQTPPSTRQRAQSSTVAFRIPQRPGAHQGLSRSLTR
jgi:hypothetical protein